MTTTRTPETADPTNPASLEDRTERAWKTVHRRGSFLIGKSIDMNFISHHKR